jgi:predicted permease
MLKTRTADDMIGAMSIWIVLEKVSIIFALVLLGYVFSKLTKLKDSSAISKLVLNVSVPASILFSITKADYNAIKDDMIVLIIVSVSIAMVTLVLSFAMTSTLRMKSPVEKAVYRSALFFNNYGFMGWPICELLLGTQGLLYAALYSIPIHLLAYSITPALMKTAGDGKKLFDKSMLINLPFYATLVGLLVLMTGIKLPDSMTGFLEMVGVTQTPLSMMVIGMILAGAKLKDVVKGFKPYAFSAIRLLLLPISVFLILRAIGLTGLLISVPVVITAMPAGAMVVVLAQKHETDPVLTSRLTVISTLLSIATIPIISMLVL